MTIFRNASTHVSPSTGLYENVVGDKDIMNDEYFDKLLEEIRIK